MKRFVALILVVVLVLSFSGVTAFAEVKRLRGLNITASTRNVAVGRTIYLDFSMTPSDTWYDWAEWSTDDPHIVEIDSDGGVTGIVSGKATVRVRLYAYDYDDTKNASRYYSIGSDDIEITVTGSPASDGYVRRIDEIVDYTSGATNGAVDSADLTSAVKRALVRNTTTYATLADYDSVSASALRSAASAMSGGTVMLNFDTMDRTAVEGRLTVNPASAAGLSSGFYLGVYTNEDQVGRVERTFQKYIKNNVAIIKTAQDGSYGMNVKIAAKIDSTLAKSPNLRLYSYNAESGKYSEIQGASVSVDSNGYAHFYTAVGGYLVISDGPLTSKG